MTPGNHQIFCWSSMMVRFTFRT